MHVQKTIFEKKQFSGVPSRGLNRRQYCFSRPLKLEVHVRYWTTGKQNIQAKNVYFVTFKGMNELE